MSNLHCSKGLVLRLAVRRHSGIVMLACYACTAVPVGASAAPVAVVAPAAVAIIERRWL